MSKRLFKVTNRAGKTRNMVAEQEDDCRVMCKELKFVSRTKHLIVEDVTSNVMDGSYFNKEEGEIFQKHLTGMVDGMTCCKYEEGGKPKVGVFCNIYKTMHWYE